MKDILFIVCSRGRPGRFAEMARAVLNTAAHPERVSFALYIDADDLDKQQYYNIAAGLPCMVLVNPKKRTINDLYNEMAMKLRSDIYGVIADDVVCRTQDWDLAIEYVLTDGDLQTVSPHDGQDMDHYAHFFVTREWLDTIGYLFWPEFDHFHADTQVLEIVSRAGQRAVLPHVLFEHMHFKYNLAPVDETYMACRKGPYLEGANALLKSLRPETEAAAQRALAKWGKTRHARKRQETRPVAAEG